MAEKDKRLGGFASDAQLNEIERALLEQTETGIVSTDDVDETIEKAVSGLRTGREEAERGIEARFERERGEVREAGETRLTGVVAGATGLGPASRFQLVQRIEEATEKSLRDLDLREQEALATGRTEVASQIANLKLQQLTFRTQAQQQAFSNLLSIMGERREREKMTFEEKISERQLSLQERQTLIAEQGAERQEQAEIANVALEFGIDVRPGDTLENVVNRAKETGAVSAKRELELEALRADIARSKAETQRALERGDKLSDLTIESLARSVVDSDTPDEIMGSIIRAIEDPETLGKFTNEVNRLNSPRIVPEDELRRDIQSRINANESNKDIITEIGGSVSITNKEDAFRILRQMRGLTEKDERQIKAIITGQEEKAPSLVERLSGEREEIEKLSGVKQTGLGTINIEKSSTDSLRQLLETTKKQLEQTKSSQGLTGKLNRLFGFESIQQKNIQLIEDELARRKGQ